MVSLPAVLVPTTAETIRLEDGRHLEIPKATPTFSLWKGEMPEDRYGGKAVLDYGGDPMFAEFVILRLLETVGWGGAWIDTYRGQRLSAPDVSCTIPEQPRRTLDAIFARAESQYGCFDIFAWNEHEVLFVEAKRAGRDRIRTSQIRWLTAALDSGLSVSSLLVVEWTAA